MSEVQFLQEGLPFVRNDCTRPPHRLMKHLQQSLRDFPKDDMKGLGALWLYDEIPNDAHEEGSDIPRAGVQTRGSYYLKTKEYDSYILLFINAIYYSLDEFPFCEFTSVPALCISKTLAHEVAHHLIATRGYAIKSGEDITDQESLADLYAQRHLDELCKQGRFRFAFWLMKQIADLHYSVGSVYATKHKYCNAADSWFKAWLLNPKLENVGAWYHLAKEKCKNRKEPRANSVG